jgi:hypothetical protein
MALLDHPPYGTLPHLPSQVKSLQHTPSFLRKQEPIQMVVNASLPDGFLLSQE